MEYTIDRNLEDFQAWAGGKATLEVLIEKGDCETVENYITECFSHPTDTDINDFLWFSRDEIAEYLGYEDWDAYENGDQTYEDINGVELAVSDEVKWHDEAGVDENGEDIVFTIVDTLMTKRKEGMAISILPMGTRTRTPKGGHTTPNLKLCRL